LQALLPHFTTSVPTPDSIVMRPAVSLSMTSMSVRPGPERRFGKTYEDCDVTASRTKEITAVCGSSRVASSRAWTRTRTGICQFALVKLIV
jgi:hypothetical protein